ncbi:MAG: hypothetical protein ACXWOV_16330, partial [Isosphaeraceae bacterium]
MGVPLWLCALGIFVILFNNRKLRKRHGDMPVRVRRTGKERWVRGHAVWVSDVRLEGQPCRVERRCAPPMPRSGRSCAASGTTSRSRAC